MEKIRIYIIDSGVNLNHPKLKEDNIRQINL